jgi:hypothetical protein
MTTISGLDPASLRVVSDIPIDGAPAGTDLGARFRSVGPGVWEYRFARPLRNLARARLTVTVRDRQGNVTRVDRTFSVD